MKRIIMSVSIILSNALVNLSFLMGLLNAFNKNILLIKLVTIFEYATFLIWLYYYVPRDTAFSAMLWCIFYCASNLSFIIYHIIKNNKKDIAETPENNI